MEQIKELNVSNLVETYKRLKKDTKKFSSLLIRDIFDNLDFEINIQKNLQFLIFNVENNEYYPRRPRVMESPKGKGINRPTIVFDINDALIFRFCIEQIQDDIFKKTRLKNIRGGTRIKANKSPSGDTYYEKWFQDWKEHNDSIVDSLRIQGCAATTDIASYFEHISLLILKDLIRSDVKDKQGVVNLLFYFLENVRLSDNYETNTFTGLPQDDIDCSRTLAYYFLNPLDKELIKFSRDQDAEYYRFVDDMTVVVNKEVKARKALKTISCSLRKLGLMSSIEKTQILECSSALAELFYDENNVITELEDRLLDNIKNKKSIKKITQEAIDLYERLKLNGSSKNGWIKILKRFYTTFSYCKSDALFKSMISDLISFPIIGIGPKIIKYIIRNKKSQNFENLLLKIIDYLYSDENLYPALESNLLEIFLYLDSKDLSKKTLIRVQKMANNIFYKTHYVPLSEYSRALACLLVFKFENKSINTLARNYLRVDEKSEILKKYLIAVSLSSNKHYLRSKVIEKAKREQSQSIANLIEFIENIKKYKKLAVVKNYVRNEEIYIHHNQKKKFSIKEKHFSSRRELLKRLLSIYS